MEQEVKEYEYICVTCGKITKRENDVDTIIKCDNCDGQAMLRYWKEDILKYVY